MNWGHFRTFLWLRWRIRLNQLKKAGAANLVVLALLSVFLLPLPLMLFVGLLAVGYFLLPQAPPVVVVLVWDGLALAFVFSWAVGLLAELQRSEVLSLNKFLYLPVSVKGVFLINYFSSVLSVTVLLFLPAMIGLGLGLVFSKGPVMLLVFLLVPAFFLMVTALTYQLQGWLASLMVNKRRRRTIIVVATMAIVLLAQLPNLLNVVRPWDSNQDAFRTQQTKERDEIMSLRQKKEISDVEQAQRLGKLEQDRKARDQEWEQNAWRQIDQTAWLANIVVPIGWLPLGAWTAAEGNIWPSLLGALGMALIGVVSLRRSYRTTVRLYTGYYTSGKGKPTTVPAASATAIAGKVEVVPAVFLEKKLPWLSEQAAVIALTSLRGLIRAPEAKMMLLTPLIMVLVFGGMFFSKSFKVPQPFRPLVAFAGMGMVLLGMVQIMGNQFGFDRSGFRVFVLCAASRRDIILGKNLGFAPLALTLAALSVILVQVLQPMRFDDFLAAMPQGLSMFLIFCMMANLLSIFAPMPIAAGSLKAAQPKLVPILLQMIFLFCMPMVQVPLLVPLAVQLVLEWWLEIVQGLPICLALSLLECVAVIFIYRLVLTWQGRLLQSRERKILEIVTTKAE